MTQAGIPLGHLVTSVQRWARHLYTPASGLCLAHGGWKTLGPGEGILALGLVIPQLPGQVFFRDLRADGKAGERVLVRRRGKRGKRQVWWVE